MARLKLMPNETDARSDHSMRPSFLIIGAQKGGTTALYQYLSQHPRIVAPEDKELNYFACSERFAKGSAYYHSFFPSGSGADPNSITFDTSPNYMAGHETAGRIHSYNPSMKMIAILRDPTYRAYSAWQMYQRFYGKHPTWYFDWMQQCEKNLDISQFIRRTGAFGRSFADDIEQEIAAVQSGDRIEAPFLRHGFYAEQLELFFQHFSRGQILILENRELRINTAAVLRKIEEFLNISHHDWQQDDLRPVFEGDYRASIEPDALKLLHEVYGARNQQLYNLLGKSFEWSDQHKPDL